jgi:PAS domain S-box-containing protein
MSGDWLDLPVGPARARLEQLSRQAKELPAEAEDLVEELLEAFAVSLEELQVAAEELQQQNQELLATREEVVAGRRRYRDLFELAPDGYLVTDSAGVITDANQAAVDLVRVPKQELVGKPLVLYIAPDDRERFHLQLDRLVEGRRTGAGESEWELQVRPRRGQAFPAALSVTSIRDAQDRTTGLLWLLRDIRASKRAVERERLLREARTQRRAAVEARRLLEALMDAMPVGTVVSDAAGAALQTNATARAMLGSDVHGSVGSPERLYTAHYPDGTPFPSEDMPLAHALEEGEIIRNVEVLIRRPDGEERTILAGAAPVLDEEDEVVRAITAFQDITALKRAEEALQEERDRLAALINSIRDEIWFADATGRFTLVNPAASGEFGLQANRPVDIRELAASLQVFRSDGTPRPVEETPPLRALRGEVVVNEEELIRTPATGELRHRQVSATPVLDGGGNIIGSVSVARDVTARRQVQAERERLAAILEETPDLVSMGTVDGELVYLNQAGRRMMGLAADADLSKLAYPPGHVEWARHLIQEEGIPVALRDGVWRGRAAVLNREGREVPVSEVVLAHREPRGEVTHLSTIARDISERERFLADLQGERARFAAIFETAPEAIMVADAEGRLQLANRAAHDLYRRPVPFGQPFEPAESVQALHLDGQPFEPAEYPFLRSALQGEQVDRVPMRLIWEDGLVRDLLVSAAPLLDLDGGPSGAVSLMQDVTQVNEIQRAVELLAVRLRILHEADRVILSADSVDQIVEAVLPVVRELTGSRWACLVAFDGEANEATLLGMETDLETRLGKGTRVAMDEGWPAKELAKGDMSLVEDVSDLPVPPSVVEDLGLQEVQSLVSVPLVVQGELLGALNLSIEDPRILTAEYREIIRQMADQLAIGLRQMALHEEVQRSAARLEEMVIRRTVALQASEARFRSIFEDSVLGIALLDTEGQILAANPALKTVLGYSEKELKGTRLSDYRPADAAHEDSELYEALVSGELGYYQIDLRYARKTGQERWCELTVSRVERIQGGRPWLAIAMLEDITEKRVNQEALLRAERLALAGRLGASLAHEINNPLQAVIGSLGLAEEMLEDDAEVRRYLVLAMEELERAASIVTQLRDLSREPKAIEAKPADLNALVEKVLLLTRKDCLNRGVEVAWSPDAELPAVSLASERMRQVFLNLVLNAVEAMPEGGRLHVSTSPTREPRGARVIFADTGDGIEPDRVPRIFEPFHSSRPEGLGLGLYISRNIVEEHGGQIDVESQVGAGTTFTIWLPA